MNANRKVITWVEVIALLIIAFFAIGLCLPAVRTSREAGRRAHCLNNLRQIGLALHSYESSNGAFPPSANIISNGPGKPATVGGWSFLVRILPFMEYDKLYRSLPTDGDPEDTSNSATVAAMNTSIREYVCPSTPNQVFQYPSNDPALGAFTNYKGMGASTKSSLMIAVDKNLPPPYGTVSLHPDGMMAPGKGTLRDDVTDGLSHTIATIETIDDKSSRWTVGKEVTLVGLPQTSSPTGGKPEPPYPYFVPSGYDGKYGDASGVTQAGLRTFLFCDFSPGGADAGKYEDPGFSSTPPAYGPSSGHVTVVNCVMGDGSAQAISKRIDAANLFFLITKNNSDPFNIP